MKPLLVLLLLCSPCYAQRVLLPHTADYASAVRVTCPLPQDRCTFGSAVVLDDRHALTAYHCIRKSELTVLFPDPVPADVIAIHTQYDWALLRFRSPIAAPSARIRPDALPVGSTVYGFGFGKVGSFGYTKGRFEGSHITGCLIEPGDSGGPVTDETGALVGLVTEYDVGTCDWRGYAVGSQAFRDFCNLRFSTHDNVRMVD